MHLSVKGRARVGIERTPIAPAATIISRLALTMYRGPEDVPNCTPVAVAVPDLKMILVTYKFNG